MNKIYSLAVSICVIITIFSCSKRTYPSQTSTPVNANINPDTSMAVKKKDTLLVKKPVIKREPKVSVPKVIAVNDKYAKKSVDGRLYYDLQGQRYWRNNKDGKYYLFNKSMLSDDAFKKPN